jgi:hypothetical protein
MQQKLPTTSRGFKETNMGKKICTAEWDATKDQIKKELQDASEVCRHHRSEAN